MSILSRWQLVALRGPALALAAILVIHPLALVTTWMPLTFAALVTLTFATAYAALLAGLASGLLTSAIAVGYIATLVLDQIPSSANPESLWMRVLLLAVAFPSGVWLLDRQRLREQAARRAEAEALAAQEAELTRARELDQLKTQFVNAVSHELRTPLTSVLGYAEFLADGIGGELSPQQASYVAELEHSARRLERLVDDLLDFARIESGTFQLRVAKTDLAPRVAALVESVRPQANERRQTLSLTLPDDARPVACDADRIGQVLLNMLSNAIKFTPASGTIAVSMGARGDRLRIAVRDSGPGIAPADMPKLFQRFSQLGDAGQPGGVGLGLSISKAIVEAHGGTIGVDSRAGEGSTFWFELPRGDA